MSLTNQTRQRIRELAGHCCEYCRVAEDKRVSRFQIDHIVPHKYDGKDEVDNLCLA